MFLTTRGLVLREVRYKEADKILTVLTQHEGKVTVRARGALRKGSRITAATQLLTYSDMTIFENRGRRTLNEASTVEEFLGLRADLGAFALGSYFAELLETVSAEEYPDPPVLQLGLNSLYALSRALCPPEQIKAVFELRLMCLAGYEPDLSCCAQCGAAEPDEPWFSPRGGAVYCAHCRGRKLLGRHAAAAGDAGRHAAHRERRPQENFFLHARRRRAADSLRMCVRIIRRRSSNAASRRSITGRR